MLNHTNGATGLHPIIAAALSPHLDSPLTLRRAQYVTALRAHDWSHEFSDDHSVFERGNRERSKLLIERAEIDEDWSIWNREAPEGYRMQVIA